MKRLVIIRFGTTQPLPKEFPIIEKLSNLETAIGMSFGQMGVLSIIETQASADEVVAEFKRVAAETDDTLPVIVFELGSPSAAFDLDAIPNFSKVLADLGVKETQPLNSCTLSLDELLDLVASKGLDNLTQEEYSRLKKLTEEF